MDFILLVCALWYDNRHSNFSIVVLCGVFGMFVFESCVSLISVSCVG